MADLDEIVFAGDGSTDVNPNLQNQIRIWLINLDSQKTCLLTFWETLSDEEKKRANAYFSTQDKSRFILRRGFLRSQLGSILACSPEVIKFRYTKYGKPELDYPEQTKIDFSLAHSSGLALFAFTEDRQIGVDLEKKREDIELLALAGRFFSQSETEALRALPPDQLTRCFFKCWTRKEAFVKAHGEGLSVPLDHFDVNFSLEDAPRILATRGKLEPADQWSLVDIEVGPDFESALAVYGPIPELQLFAEHDFMPGIKMDATSEVMK